MNDDQKKSESNKKLINTTRLIRRDQQDASSSIEFWQQLSASERLAAAWEIAKKVQSIKGKSGDLLRMQKSVARRVHRSKAEESYDPSTDLVFEIVQAQESKQ